MSWLSKFLRRGPEAVLEELYALRKARAPVRDIERGLARMRRHGRNGLKLLLRWITGEEDDKAYFAATALAALRDTRALPLLEPLLESAHLPDERLLLLAEAALALGADIDMDAVWDRIADPAGLVRRTTERFVSLAEDPATVEFFLDEADRSGPGARDSSLSLLGGLPQDPRAVRLWAPLLYNHGGELGERLAGMIRAGTSSLARWWAAELIASRPGSPAARALAGISGSGEPPGGRTGPSSLPTGTFHKAFLGAPDKAGSRQAVFSQSLASGDLLYIRFTDNDRLGVMDASGGRASERGFLDALSRMRGRGETLMAAASGRAVARVMRDSERRTFKRGRRFPPAYLSLKEAFFCRAEPAVPPAEAGFESFWSAGAGAPPSERDVEELLRCPCAGGWSLSEAGFEKEMKGVFKRARKKARRTSAGEEAWPEHLPGSLPDALLALWRRRLKDYAFAARLAGLDALAATARDCAASLAPASKARHPFLRALALKTALPAARAEAGSAARSERPLARLIDWVTEHPRLGPELSREIRDRLPHERGALRLDEGQKPALAILMEWFMFDRPSRLDGRTPLEVFLGEAGLDPAERAVFEGWRRGFFGVFKVLDREIGRGVAVRHMRTGRKYKVRERLGSLQILPGQAVFARLLPMPDGHVFGGGLVLLPEEAAYAAERTFKPRDLDMAPLGAVSLLLDRKEPLEEEDMEALEGGIERLLKAWKVRWYTVPAVKRRLASAKGAVHPKSMAGDMAELVDEILLQADSSPADRDAVDKLLPLLQALQNRLPLPDGTRRKAAMPAGPRERALTYALTREAGLERADSSSARRDFVEGWLDTPQKELGGSTPRREILRERRARGDPSGKIELNVSAVAMPDPESPAFEYRKAIRCFKEGEFDQAVSRYETLARVRSRDKGVDEFRFLGNLGIARVFSGDRKGGLRELRRALRLKPGYETALGNLSMVEAHGAEFLRLYGHLMGARCRRKIVEETPYPDGEKALRLAELIAGREAGWPVPEMELLMGARGAAAGAERVLAESGGSGLLPLLVVLAEIGAPKALALLGEALLREQNLLVAGAAAELMAGFGESFDPLTRMLSGRLPLERRRLVYGALGLGKSPKAYPVLLKALEEDRDAADSAAYALALLGEKEAMGRIYRAYLGPAAPETLGELEGAMGLLEHPAEPRQGSWRVRWRPDPDIGGPRPGLHTLTALLVDAPPRPSGRAARTPRKSLDAILEEGRREREQARRDLPCVNCGGPTKEIHGVRICPDDIPDFKRDMLEWVDSLRKAGCERVADGLDLTELERLDDPGAEDGEDPMLHHHCLLSSMLENGVRSLTEVERLIREIRPCAADA